MTGCPTDHIELREVFNSTIKPKYRETHTPQCRKCMRFHRWGNSIMEVHHIKALIDGGTNDEDNLVILCYQCHEEWHNHREGTITFSEWLQQIPLYVYSAIGLSHDKAIKKAMFCNINDMWPAIRDRRMVTEPWDERNREYTEKNCHKWIDW